MDYGQIIKHSWEIVKNNRFLWGLGVLAAFTAGGGGMGFSNGSSFRIPQATSSPVPLVNTSTPFASVTPGLISLLILLGTVLLIIFILIIYFSLSANAGLIVSANSIEDSSKKYKFKTAIKEGRKYFWGLLGAGLLMFFALVVALLLSLLPILALIPWHSGPALIIFVPLFIVLLFVFLILSFYLGILAPFIQRLIVLEKTGVVDAYRKAHSLFKRNWKDYLLSFAISFGIGLLYGFAIIIALVLVAGILGVIGILIYTFAGALVATIYGVIVSIPVIIVLFFIGGVFAAFVSTYWTLVYRAIKYLDGQKT